MKHDKYRTQLEEVSAPEQRIDKRALSKRFSRSAEVIRSKERQLLLMVEEKQGAEDRPELILNCLSEEKKIIDILCEDMVAAVGAREMSVAKEIKAKLLRHLKRYNAFVAEYGEKTGSSLTVAPYTIPDDIIAGRDYAKLPELSYSREEIGEIGDGADSGEVELISTKEFMRFASKSDKAVTPLLEKYDDIKAKKALASGQEKVILIIDALAIKKQLIASESEVVRAAARSTSMRDLREAKRILLCEIRDYNALVDEYEALTGNTLTRADTGIPELAAAGKEWPALPSITYTVNDPTKGGREDKNYRNANKNVQNAAYNGKKLANTALENKISEQANKDLSVLTKRADFQISMLESERDITRYRFGMPPRATEKRKREIATEIAQIKLAHKEALRYEESDNRRYYEAVRINPETESFAKKNADRTRLASLRSKIITLLNKRDEINSQLVAIYTGTEVDATGVSINQEWRRVKAAAADRVIANDRKIAKRVEKLPATPAEKQRIYAAMNRKLDAESTIALCEYRLKKEKLQKQEIKDIKDDIVKQRKISRQCAEDVNWMCDRINRRYGGKSSSAGWVVGFLILFLVVAGAAAAFLWLFGKDILGAIGLL